MPIITSLGVFPGKPLKGEQKYSKLYKFRYIQINMEQ